MELHAVNGYGSARSKNSVDEVGDTLHIIESELPSADQRDAQALARLGKKPVLKVRDSWWKCLSSSTVGGAERPLATLHLHRHVGLHMYSSGDLGSHPNVNPFLPRHRIADRILMGLGSIYVTGLTKYALPMDLPALHQAE